MSPTAQHMVEMLRRHYQPEGRPPAGVFAPEIASPCGRRRADAVWMPTTIAGGKGDLVGHEIKVTRQDVLVELSDPTKADPWSQYCTHWWLVVAHPTLIAGLDIPAAWGVMAPPSGRRTRTATIVRPAPKLVPVDPAAGYARLATWMLHNGHDRSIELQQRIGILERDLQRHEATISELRAGGGRRDPRADRVLSILTAVEGHCRDSDRFWRDVDDEVVIAAILDAAATVEVAESARLQVRSIIRTVERLAKDPLGHVLRELREAERLTSSRTAVLASAVTAAGKKAGMGASVADPAVNAAIAAVRSQFPEARAS